MIRIAAISIGDDLLKHRNRELRICHARQHVGPLWQFADPQTKRDCADYTFVILKRHNAAAVDPGQQRERVARRSSSSNEEA